MLVINEKQMELLHSKLTAQFISESKIFLKGNFKHWAKNKKEEELDIFLWSMLKISKKYNIKKEINIQKLMHYHIQFEHEITNNNLVDKYCGGDIPEDNKVEILFINLSNKNFLRKKTT